MSTGVLFECLEILLIVLVVSLLVKWIVISRAPVKNFPPGPPGLPLIGNALSLMSAHPLELFSNWAKEYGDIVHFRFGPTRFILLNSSGVMSEAFQNSDLNGRNPSTIRYKSTGLIHEGITLNVGEAWSEQRQYMHNVFRQLGIGKRSYEDTITTEIAQLSDAIEKFHGCPFDPNDLISCAVSNVLCTSVFGTQYSFSDSEFREFNRQMGILMNVLGSGSLLVNLPIPGIHLLPFGRPKALADSYRALISFMDDMIHSHKKVHVPDQPRDFIDLYLTKMAVEEGKDSSFDRANLKATIFDLLVAGTETTSASLKWSLMYMMAYPDVQSRVQRELDEGVGKGRVPSLSDQKNLPYTNAVIQECQRVSRITPLGVTHIAMKDTVLRDFTIPKGSMVYGNIGHVLMDERVWDAPQEFRPERFLTAEGNVTNKKGMIPFGTGRRVCAGEQLARQELFLFFTGLLHRFSFKKPDDSKPLSFAGVVGVTRNTEPFTTSAVKRNT